MIDDGKSLAPPVCCCAFLACALFAPFAPDLGCFFPSTDPPILTNPKQAQCVLACLCCRVCDVRVCAFVVSELFAALAYSLHSPNLCDDESVREV